MPLPNPWYIDANARHVGATQRLVAFMAMQGEEGVLRDTDLKVTALPTPGAAVNVAPGGYSVKATHADLELYLGKIPIQEQATVNAVPSTGERTDLVILRIENPSVGETTIWSSPADPLNGPYAHIRVIEGVTAGTNSVKSHNNTWSAITLAKIIRPANTGVVNPEHITGLRSLADPAQQRINIPGQAPPPIAVPDPVVNVPCPGEEELPPAVIDWAHWPTVLATLAVPFWATHCRVLALIFNTEARTGRAAGQFRARAAFGSELEYTAPDEFVARAISSSIPNVVLTGMNKELTIRPNWRGQQVTFRLEAKHDSGSGGPLAVTTKTKVQFMPLFLRRPS